MMKERSFISMGFPSRSAFLSRALSISACATARRKTSSQLVSRPDFQARLRPGTHNRAGNKKRSNRPETERQSHYFRACLPDQFDAVLPSTKRARSSRWSPMPNGVIQRWWSLAFGHVAINNILPTGTRSFR